MAKQWIAYLLKQKTLELLTATVNGGRSNLFLLGVKHRDEISIEHAKMMVRAVKPDILFLETDQIRAKSLPYHVKPSEFYAAIVEAKQMGINNIVYGDMDFQVTLLLMARRREELAKSNSNKMQVEHQVHKEILLDLRNTYMMEGLTGLLRDGGSVLAIVGRKHLPGMAQLWRDHHNP